MGSTVLIRKGSMGVYIASVLIGPLSVAGLLGYWVTGLLGYWVTGRCAKALHLSCSHVLLDPHVLALSIQTRLGDHDRPRPAAGIAAVHERMQRHGAAEVGADPAVHR